MYKNRINNYWSPDISKSYNVLIIMQMKESKLIDG